MNLRLCSVDLQTIPIQTRMPFRYGIATMTALPHLVVRVQIQVDDQVGWGVAADSLAPKWFDKNPDTTFDEDIEAMLAVVRQAAAHGLAAGPTSSVFALWLAVYEAQKAWAAETSYPPLLWNFGVSLMERAIIDAFCRLREMTFAQALRDNAFGVHLAAIHPELAGHAPADFLPPTPLDRLMVRHTVGLGDPLTDEDIPEDERLDDGLPQSLVASIQAYGLSYFKIKIAGDPDADRARLRRIAGLLQAHVHDYRFSLDGNENYRSVKDFRTLWEALRSDPGLATFLTRLLWVEQPLHRDVSLTEETGAALASWPDHPPIIIDESDAELSSLPTALALGYAGTSHKNCKGVFKGLANACLLRWRKAQTPDHPAILSGEDLSNIGPVALLQDLAVLASLGVPHAERNGHHYFAGLSMFSPAVQEEVLVHHSDLYRRHTTPDGRTFPVVHIQQGCVALGSVLAAPFGTRIEDPIRDDAKKIERRQHERCTP